MKARSAVMAGGSWTSKHVIKDLPAAHSNAYAQFYRSPCLMANVAVRNWRFLQKLGITGCRWFDGFGSEFTVYRKAIIGDADQTLSPDSPVVLTLKERSDGAAVVCRYLGLDRLDCPQEDGAAEEVAAEGTGWWGS